MSSERGDKGGRRDAAATADTRSGLVAFLAAAAVVFGGCSSQTKPTGTGGSGAGGVGDTAGVAGIGGVTGAGGTGEIKDAQADNDGPESVDSGDSGDSGDQCTMGKACHTNGDCCFNEACFIGATIADCASAPMGVCTFFRGGNCGTHANSCDCLTPGTGTGASDVSCRTVAGTQCHSVSNTFESPDDCFACVPCGGSGQDCCTQGGSLGPGTCNAGLTCTGPAGPGAIAKCTP